MTQAERFGVPRTQLVMLAAAGGLLLGLLIVFFNFSSWDKETRELAHSSTFVLWVALIASQTLLWTLAFPPLLSTFRAHWQERTSARQEVIPAAVVLVALVLLLALGSPQIGQLPQFTPYHHEKIQLLTVIALLTTLVASMSIWLIRGRLEKLSTAESVTPNELQTYLRLRSDLEWLLAYLGAVIGLAVLASAALRRFALLYGERHGIEIDFPVESVVLYGFTLTLLVALVYLPTFATLHQTGTALRDRVEPLPEPNDDTFETRLSKRSALDDLLGLRLSASTSFRAGVAILSPLLASLTSLLPQLGG